MKGGRYRVNIQIKNGCNIRSTIIVVKPASNNVNIAILGQIIILIVKYSFYLNVDASIAIIAKTSAARDASSQTDHAATCKTALGYNSRRVIPLYFLSHFRKDLP